MTEVELDDAHKSVLFDLSKALGGITLVLNVFLLIQFCLLKTPHKTFIYQIKIELIVACLLHPIGSLLPTIESKKDETSKVIDVFCHLQTLLTSCGNITVVFIFTSILFVTYKILVAPKFIEDNPRKVLLRISLFSWGVPLIMTIIFEIFGKSQYTDYLCWYSDDTMRFITFIINFIVFISFIILIVVLKKKLKLFYLKMTIKITLLQNVQKLSFI